MATKLSGMKQVRKAVRQMPVNLKAESAKELRRTVDEGHALGRSRIPVRTGEGARQYRKSFNVKTLRGRFGYLTPTAFAKVFYMRFIHDGTAKISGNYFHDRAFDAVEPGFFPAQNRALSRALKK